MDIKVTYKIEIGLEFSLFSSSTREYVIKKQKRKRNKEGKKKKGEENVCICMH